MGIREKLGSPKSEDRNGAGDGTYYSVYYRRWLVVGRVWNQVWFWWLVGVAVTRFAEEARIRCQGGTALILTACGIIGKESWAESNDQSNQQCLERKRRMLDVASGKARLQVWLVSAKA